jgi:hypothetical protein
VTGEQQGLCEEVGCLVHAQRVIIKERVVSMTAEVFLHSFRGSLKGGHLLDAVLMESSDVSRGESSKHVLRCMCGWRKRNPLA